MQVNNAKPKAKEYNLADGDGLYLLVIPKVTKSWMFSYYQPYSKNVSGWDFGSIQRTLQWHKNLVGWGAFYSSRASNSYKGQWVGSCRQNTNGHGARLAFSTPYYFPLI